MFARRRGEPVLAVRPEGADGPRLLGGLGRRLAARPAGAALLLEWGTVDPDWRVAGGDRETSDLLARTLRSFGLSVRPAPERPGNDAGPTGFGVLVGVETSDPPARPTAHPATARRGSFPREPPPRGPWAVQLHLGSSGSLEELRASLRYAVADADGRGASRAAELSAHLGETLAGSGISAGARGVRTDRRSRREWASGALGRFGSRPPLRLPVDALHELATGMRAPRATTGEPPESHAAVFGASGSGKSALLAEWGVQAIRRGRSVFALDLHGDLGPSIVARLGPEARERVIALDAEGAPGPGIDLFGRSDRAALAHLVAGLRRGSDDRGDVYWGFRLDRLFAAFVALAAEEGGDLRDLYGLLTDERRREAARLSTGSAERARFLDELGPILRRSPDFLWPAAARLARLVEDPALAALLAPGSSAVDPSEAWAQGQSLLVRVPLARFGPELAGLAASLLAARVYFDRVRAAVPPGPTLLLLLDEAQAYSATLIAEILSEGRKFGIAAVVATQFPNRLAEGLRGAVAGAIGTHVVLRTPAPAVPEMCRWLGVDPEEAAPWLTELAPGAGWVRRTGVEGVAYRPPTPYPSGGSPDVWGRIVLASRERLGPLAPAAADLPARDLVLLRALRRRELSVRGPGAGAVSLEGPLPGAGPGGLLRLARRGWVAPRADADVRVTPAGLAYLGERAETGAVRESAAHRALLAEAARLFARNGEALEIVRQGRFDSRLPDARLRLIPPVPGGETPRALLDRIAERRRTWAWRAFGGRDVQVEAEVSGATRRARIRRDLQKAKATGAHLLIVVGDPAHARSVRRTLREFGAVDATVWVLRPRRPEETPPETGEVP